VAELEPRKPRWVRAPTICSARRPEVALLLGDGTTTDSSTPVKVSGITNAITIATGMDHSCAVLADHTVACWATTTVVRSATGPRQTARLSERQRRSG